MNKGRTSVQAAWTAALALALLVCGWSSTPGQEGESAKSDKLPAGSARPQLTKLPMAYHDSMENTPVICDARPLLVLNYRNDTKNRSR